MKYSRAVQDEDHPLGESSLYTNEPLFGPQNKNLDKGSDHMSMSQSQNYPEKMPNSGQKMSGSNNPDEKQKYEDEIDEGNQKSK